MSEAATIDEFRSLAALRDYVTTLNASDGGMRVRTLVDGKTIRELRSKDVDPNRVLTITRSIMNLVTHEQDELSGFQVRITGGKKA